MAATTSLNRPAGCARSMRLVVACALLLALAGCSAAPADTATTTSTTSSPPPPAMMDHTPKTVEVSMQGNQFVNRSIEIYQGDTVKWTHNDGNTPHDVASDDPAFDSRPNCSPPVGVPLTQVCMVDGDTWSETFDEVGEVNYRCDIHPGMTGSISVMAHPM